jgi:hypothetical protein
MMMVVIRRNHSNAETRPSATPSTEYLTWAGPGSNLGLPRASVATECLSRDAARCLLSPTADVTQGTQ